jgi:rhamnogalacturonan endolyase
MTLPYRIPPRRRAASPPAFEFLEHRTLFAFGLTTTSGSYTVDTGAGLVFSVSRTAGAGSIGDLTSTKLNGTELEAPFSATSRYSHYESGLGGNTVVSATVDPSGQWILITCDDSADTLGVTQYYAARKGYNDIYMATYAPGPNSPSPGEMRFIMYANHAVLTSAPAPSDNTGSSGAIESSDVFGHPDGTTTSKYYGEYRAIDAQTYGLTGDGFGLFMNIGNRETSSGGPFFKDIDFQTTSAASTELYTYVFSGHSQTESFRPGLKGFYALQFTTGTATPAAPDYAWLDTSGLASHLAGYVPAGSRGALAGTASGVPSSYPVTVALSNATAQYWTTPTANGAYTIANVLPGTYTESLYQGELSVGTTSVTIAASQTATQNITDTLYTPSAANTVFRVGNWDGTPLGLLNADKITAMHPTDVRMSPWAADSTGLTNFTVGVDPDSAFPMAEWHTQNSAAPYVDTKNRITFNLTAAQAGTPLTLRIGLTRLDQGRPTVTVNSSWNSPVPALTSQPNSRGLTTGNWRGNNCTYSFDIPTSALHAGTNTIDIYCTSGATGTLYAGYQIYDAIDLVTTASLTNAPVLARIAITPSTPSLAAGARQTFTATGYDQFGQPMPANFAWSSARGTVDGAGAYAAPPTAGADTVTATSGSLSGSAAVGVVSTVAGRYVFYNGSSYDGNDESANAADDAAIAPDKQALLPGQTATFANYTSYYRGLNGLMIDVAGLPAGVTPNAADLTFKTGTSLDPTTWATAPAPASITVRRGAGAGAGGSDRITVVWADNSIQNAWLQVSVKATASTGLAAPDVFYFGNCIGEAGNSTSSALVTVADVNMAKALQGGATITSPVDFNRSGVVTIADVNIAKAYQNAAIPLLTAPASPSAATSLTPALTPAAVQRARRPLRVRPAPRSITWRISSGQLSQVER